MPCKPLTFGLSLCTGCRFISSKTVLVLILGCYSNGVDSIAAAEANLIAPQFLGSQSCSSSSCHGGGGNNQNQFTTWSARDFHHERPVALLETRRSAVIAENLHIDDPTHNDRCTSCHAPLRAVPQEQLGPLVKSIEGVSCENCHAPASPWVRSHTRKDWTNADRVSVGMRDLQNLYVRANTCVACHQNVDLALRRAGHPELVFELDGQSVTEPRHWRKSKDKPGPQIWLVGQAVALREMTWQLSLNGPDDARLHEQWAGLLWVLDSVAKTQSRLPTFDPSCYSAQGKDLQRVQQWCDEFAKAAAALAWSDTLTRQCLGLLAETSKTFSAADISTQIRARRAERLVLGLDRLVLGYPKTSADSKLNQSLDQLFADVQSLPDFDPNRFAQHLNDFHVILANVSN